MATRDRCIVTVSAIVASERTLGFLHYCNLALDCSVEPCGLNAASACILRWLVHSLSPVAVLKDIFAERDIGSDQWPSASPDPLPVGDVRLDDDKRQISVEYYYGAITPNLVKASYELLYSNVWRRPDLSPRDRNLVTVVALMATGETEFLEVYLAKAETMGASSNDVAETLVHLPFYIGWPKAMVLRRPPNAIMAEVDSYLSRETTPRCFLEHQSTTIKELLNGNLSRSACNLCILRQKSRVEGGATPQIGYGT